MEFKKYQRKGLSEMRPYVKGEDISSISVSKEDNPEEDMGMIARNPKNHEDQWYVARKYFEDNLELAEKVERAKATGETFLDRLIIERDELGAKINKLNHAIENKLIPNEELPILRLQLKSMDTYLSILEMRLEKVHLVINN